MDLKTLKSMKLDDLLNVDMTKLNEDEIAYVEKRLVRTANRRLERLKETGKIAQSKLSRSEKKPLKTYKAPKNRVRVSRGGKKIKINVRNKRMESAKKARDLLSKRTSQTRAIDAQTERYKSVIRDTLGKSDLRISNRQAKRISKLMKKAEELYDMGSSNKKLSGSPKVLQAVVDIVKNSKYIKNDDAEQIIKDAVENGYEHAKQLMDRMLNEDSEGVTFDDFDDTDIFG